MVRRLRIGAAFEIGRAVTVREGADLTIASAGPILSEALGAADLLAEAGIDAAVLHFGTVKPLDTAAIAHALARTGLVLTLEEHSVLGGFGSAVAEVAAETGAGRVVRAGFPDTFVHEVGSREYLLERHGLHAAGVAARAVRALETAPRALETTA